MPNFPFHTYELPYDYQLEEGTKIYTEFTNACNWLDSLGFDHNRTRFGEYKKIIKGFGKNKYSDKSDKVIEEQFYRYLNAFMEILELIRIKSTFEDRSHQTILNKLKKIASGQEFRNISKNDQSRDYLFELSIASRFIKAGYEVDLTELADVIAFVDSKKVFVECKRIKSEKQLKKRVKEAKKQLSLRLIADKSGRSRGIIAINVSDIINPNNSMFMISDQTELKEFNSDLLNEFINKYNDFFKTQKLKKQLGFFCEAQSHGFFSGDEAPKIASCRGVKIHFYNLKRSDENFLFRFSGNITNQSVFV